MANFARSAAGRLDLTCYLAQRGEVYKPLPAGLLAVGTGFYGCASTLQWNKLWFKTPITRAVRQHTLTNASRGKLEVASHAPLQRRPPFGEDDASNLGGHGESRQRLRAAVALQRAVPCRALRGAVAVAVRLQS